MNHFVVTQARWSGVYPFGGKNPVFVCLYLVFVARCWCVVCMPGADGRWREMKHGCPWSYRLVLPHGFKQRP
jgi:hypothetical protein